MKFDSAVLQKALHDSGASAASRWLLAFSGGLDSTVLLHALTTLGSCPPIIAVHVQHGLHDDAADWERHCRDFAAALDIDYQALSVSVDENGGRGLEAAARDERYRALGDLMEGGDWVLSAHHRDDQAETLLLNLMRGSGVDGLGAMRCTRVLTPGFLVRPLLDVPRSALLEYAQRHGLRWLDDPSNDDRRFDRNYVRHEVMPALGRRWPAAAEKMARSATLLRNASDLLREVADEDLARLGDSKGRLDVGGLLLLSRPRAASLIRHAARQRGMPPIPESALRRVLDEALCAREDAEPVVEWYGAQVRRYRGALYFVMPPADPGIEDTGKISLALPQLELTSSGRLCLVDNAPYGLDDETLRQGLRLRWRTGGERIKPAGRNHSHSLKKLLQEAGVVPWMRNRIPLLYLGDELVAVGDLWVSDSYLRVGGTGIAWKGRPELH